MKKLIVNKKTLMAVSILLILVMVAAGFWRYSNTPQVQAEGVLSINIGQNQSNAPPAKVAIDKQPQDIHTRQLLIQQGIDPEYTELVQDYGKPLTAPEKVAKQVAGNKSPDPSPYGRTYRDTISGKYILETQSLPMVDADGVRNQAGWVKVGDQYKEKQNLFNIVVYDTDGKIKLTDRNTNQSVSFSPKIYLDDVEQYGSGPILSADEKTLEWDYGIAKRQMTLIEGTYIGTWVFDKNPGGDVKAVYNQTGDFKLTLGPFKVEDDTEFVPKAAFDNPLNSAFLQEDYPLVLQDTANFQPSKDNMIRSSETTTNYGSYAFMIVCGQSNNKFRSLVSFDISSLGAGATISDSTLSLYGYGYYTAWPNGRTYWAYKQTQNNWAEASSTWIKYDASNNWGTAGGDYVTSNPSGASATVPASADAWMDWTVTAIVQDAHTNSWQANFIVKDSNENDATERGVRFYTKEEGTQTTLRPKLVVTYTVISNTPSSYQFDNVSPSSSNSTGLDYFTVTNNSGYTVNITIGGTDFTTWTLSDNATPGATTAGLKAGLSGGSYNVIVKKNAPFNTLADNVTDNATWGLQLLAPTTFTGSSTQYGTVTLTATAN